MSDQLYCLSGLGCDERVFSKLKLDGIELIHMKWIEPLKKESMSSYAKRMMKHYNLPKNCNIMGLSFGGMLASEIAKINPPKNLFLISTIKTKKELPTKYRIAQFFFMHKWMPYGLIKSFKRLTNYAFGVKTTEDKQLLQEIIEDTNIHFLKWSVNTVLYWNNLEVVEAIRIHGKGDKILNTPKSNCITIGYGHFVIFNEAEQVSSIIKKELSNLEN
jgi:esterase/lipase